MMKHILGRLIRGAVPRFAAVTIALAGSAQASNLTFFTTRTNTDVATFDIGQMRDVGTGNLTVAGLTGTISSAYLFWHGPTNSTNPASNAIVTVNGTNYSGTNIGFSQDNFWNYTNSQAYRADVTAAITGNGVYSLSNFIKGTPAAAGSSNINGASLIVFYDDGVAANNRDVVLFNGNDANFTNSFDADGWNAALNGINYSGGNASMTLHVSDGQNFADGTLRLNGTTIDSGSFFEGTLSQLGNGVSPAGSGSLWDVKSYDVTSFLTPGLNNLALTLQNDNDALSLIVAQFNLPIGAAPPAPAVPEPTTWAMLIGGFGAIGTTARRRRVLAAA